METFDPGQPFGRYTLHALLGRGGMGEVFLATGPGVAGVEKRLAIKRLLPTLADDPGFVARFLDEARLVVQLCHGNIVPVFEAGQVGRDYFLAMELVDGLNLREVQRALRERSTLCPVPLAVLVAHEVARGLDYAHRKTAPDGTPLGIIHRDVSPQNVLLGYDGEVRLVDFGIAKATGRSQLTVTGGLLGKFGYMSPEQAMGYPLDGRSDLFALGAVLHELLTGAPLFDGATDPEVLRKVQDAVVAPPSLLRPDVPPELDALVLRLLARDPKDRFRNASEAEKQLGALRYLGTTGPQELSELLRGLYTPRPVSKLSLPGLEALPAPRNVTATMQPESRSELSDVSAARAIRPSRAPLFLLALAIPAAAAGGWFASKPVVTPAPIAVVEPPKHQPAPATVVQPPADPKPTPTPVAVVARPEPTKPTPHSRKQPVKARPGKPPVASSASTTPPIPDKAPEPKPDPEPVKLAPVPVVSVEPAKAQASGTLSLRIQPWGEVEVDGQSLGQTSALVKHTLSVGVHHVRVTNPVLNRESRFDVDVFAGQDNLQKVYLDR
ncbi:MAG: protein kinase [Deltaproteobacteria bacterium]|nr:protein kinase [Deltaproteobacteria bacterium]